MPPIPDKEQRFFTPAETHQIIGAAKGQWRVLFATLATMGQRGGEAFGLRVPDLDLDALKIYIPSAIDFLAVSDAEDQHQQAVIFDLADEPVIAHTVFPELSERRAV